jgi:hypothetical protein
MVIGQRTFWGRQPLASSALALAAREGPFADPTQRLPQAPDVAAQRRAARRRWRVRQQVREAAKLAAARDDAADGDIAA